MSGPDGMDGLRFPCECVSSREGGYSDPWAAVTKRKLLPDGTKEEILNLLAREPKTISQLAEALRLSPPSVFAHVNDMIKRELLREARGCAKRANGRRIIRQSATTSLTCRSSEPKTAPSSRRCVSRWPRRSPPCLRRSVGRWR